MSDEGSELGYNGAWRRVIHGKIGAEDESGVRAKVTLEAIRGVTKVNEIAAYKVHPNHITKWKKRTQDNIVTLFTDSRIKVKKDDSAETIDRLYREVGQLQCDLSWLKKT